MNPAPADRSVVRWATASMASSLGAATPSPMIGASTLRYLMALVRIGGSTFHYRPRSCQSWPRRMASLASLNGSTGDELLALANPAAAREAQKQTTRRCCTDPAGGAAGRAGGAGRPLTCLSDAQRALQAEPGPSPPHSPATAWIMVRNLGW